MAEVRPTLRNKMSLIELPALPESFQMCSYPDVITLLHLVLFHIYFYSFTTYR